jgi:hypothetical protein
MEARRLRTSVIGSAIISAAVAIVCAALILGAMGSIGIRGDEYAELLPTGAIFLWGGLVSFLVVGPPALLTGVIVGRKCKQWLESGVGGKRALVRAITLSSVIGCLVAVILGQFAPAGMTSLFLAPIGLVVGAILGFAAATATSAITNTTCRNRLANSTQQLTRPAFGPAAELP